MTNILARRPKHLANQSELTLTGFNNFHITWIKYFH